MSMMPLHTFLLVFSRSLSRRHEKILWYQILVQGIIRLTRLYVMADLRFMLAQ